jgi:phage gp29-like protein
MTTKIEVKQITSEATGKSGTQVTAGVITGEEYNFNMVGAMALKNFNEMRSNDATVEASLSVIKTPIQAAEYYVDPASEDEADVEVADFVYDNLFHINDWMKTLWEILTYLEFGHSLFEMSFEPREVNGKLRIALKDFGFRKQTTITAWQQPDGSAGVTQQLPAGAVGIPLVRLVRFTNRQEGDNFVGRSVLRTSYKHWFMKDKLYKIDAVGHERQALGVLDITVPSGATEADKIKIRAAARALRASQNSYIEHPENWVIEFMNMQAGSMKDTEPSINHHDRQIMKNVLASFMEIGSAGSSGAYSASETQSAVFDKAVENVARYVVNVLQNTVVRALVDLNFTDRDYPKLRVGKISDDNVPVLSEAVAKYSAAGVLHARPADENTVRKQIGWGEVDEDELQELFDDAKAAKQAAADALKLRNQQSGDEPADDPKKPNEKVEASIRELKALRASVEKALYGEPSATA